MTPCALLLFCGDRHEPLDPPSFSVDAFGPAAAEQRFTKPFRRWPSTWDQRVAGHISSRVSIHQLEVCVAIYESTGSVKASLGHTTPCAPRRTSFRSLCNPDSPPRLASNLLALIHPN